MIDYLVLYGLGKIYSNEFIVSEDRWRYSNQVRTLGNLNFCLWRNKRTKNSDVIQKSRLLISRMFFFGQSAKCIRCLQIMLYSKKEKLIINLHLL